MATPWSVTRKIMWITIAGILGAIAIAMGAFGAHALRETLGERGISLFHTATQYHLVHVLALFGVALAMQQWPSPQWNWAAWAFTIGIVMFSGSLYGLALAGWKWLGPITPLGGLCFIIGWVCVCMAGFKVQ